MTTHLKKLPGLSKYGNVTLKWGITKSMDLYEWHRKLVEEGKVERKSIAIVAQDEEGKDAARWEIEEAWPTKYTPTTLNAKGNEVAIETLEIVGEVVKRTK